jgi:hypothetical protein
MPATKLVAFRDWLVAQASQDTRQLETLAAPVGRVRVPPESVKKLVEEGQPLMARQGAVQARYRPASLGIRCAACGSASVPLRISKVLSAAHIVTGSWVTSINVLPRSRHD